MSDSNSSPKALYLKPNQRKRPGTARPVAKTTRWQPHPSEYALDPWGVAIRVLKEQQISFGE